MFNNVCIAMTEHAVSTKSHQDAASSKNGVAVEYTCMNAVAVLVHN